jgi:small subunit ribosomal protein S20
MPHTKSAEKRLRQSNERRTRNRAALKRLKTQQKRVETVLTSDDKTPLAGEHNKAQKMIDQAAAKGVIHRNTAARRKARLAKSIKKVIGPTPA